MPMPTTKRPQSSAASLAANAESNAPTKNTTPAPKSVGRRPMRSATDPATAEATMQPIKTTLIVKACSRSSSANCLLMKRIAPEITPVS